jgi:mRNA interferase HigB
MYVITRKRLNEFAEKFPDTKSALARWYANMKNSTFSNIAELRAVLPNRGQVGKLTVFNIGGNKVRWIAAIHYNRRKIYVRAVLAHAEYDESR